MNWVCKITKNIFGIYMYSPNWSEPFCICSVFIHAASFFVSLQKLFCIVQWVSFQRFGAEIFKIKYSSCYN